MAANSSLEGIAAGVFVLFIIFGILAAYVVLLLFILSIRKTMLMVPKEKHKYPSWFLWMFFVPYANYVFQWIMLPFGLPATLRRQLGDGKPGEYSPARSLFKIGLSIVILVAIGIVIGTIFNVVYLVHMTSGAHLGDTIKQPWAIYLWLPLIVVTIAQIVLFIVYWVKAVGARKYLIKQCNSPGSEF